MAGPIVPAMPQATALVLGIPSYWPWHSSCCWNVTAADRWRPYTCTRLQLPSPCPLCPAAAAIAAAAARDAAAGYPRD